MGCAGRKHKENVKFYYQKWMEEQAQSLIDATTAAFKAGKLPGGMPPGGPGGVSIPPPMSMRPGMPGPPPGMPGMPPGMGPPPNASTRHDGTTQDGRTTHGTSYGGYAPSGYDAPRNAPTKHDDA